MNVFFAMDIVGSNPNDPSFFLRLPHLWPEFVIPIICFYAVLAIWVLKKVKEAGAFRSHGAGNNPPSGPDKLDQSSGTSAENEPPTGSGNGASPFDLHFYGSCSVGS